MTIRETTASGTTWVLHEHGQGTEELVLIHGFQNDHHAWDPLVAGLDPSSVRAVLPDLPGCGRSPATPDWRGSTIDAMASDLAEVLERHALVAPLLIGHSLGAAIALRLVIDRRVRARGLVLFGPASTSGLDFVPDDAFEILRSPTPEQQGALLDAAFEQRPDEETMGALRTTVLAAAATHIEGAARSLRRFVVAGSLDAVDVPTLVVVGDRDRHVPLRSHLATHAGIPRAGLHVLHRVGHVPFVEEPETARRLVREFLRDEARPVDETRRRVRP